MEILTLGSLYMGGIPTKFTGNTRISYIANSPLEFRTKDLNIENQITWLKVNNGVKQYLIATNGLLNNISYDDLSKQGLVNGQIITLEGIKYKLRLPTGGTITRINGNKNSSCNPSDNDYDKYFCNEIGLSTLPLPSGQDKTLNGYNDSTIVTSISNGILNWYGASSLTKDKVGYDVTIRGNKNSIQYYDTINQFAKSNDVMYRPILEVYNEPSTISDSDRYLNSYTASFKKAYTIYDGDADLMDIEEIVDSTTLRTLENQTTGFSTSIDLASIWDSLTYDTHTITIKVTDSFGNITLRKWTFKKIQIVSGESTNLTKPLIVTTNNSGILNPINSLEENTISFSSLGGDLIYFNEINITTNDSNANVVYNRKLETFDFESIILKNSLINGLEYQVKIRTYNDNNQYSAFSDVVLLKTFSKPELIINGIVNNLITIQNPLFTAEYYQSDTYIKADGTNVTTSDTLYSYQFILLKDGEQIDESAVLTDGLLSWQCSTNLNNKTNYQIKLLVLTNGGVETSITEEFYCIYQQTRFNALLQVSNIPKEGATFLQVFAKQIVGRLESGDSQFVDGEWWDGHSGILLFDDSSPFKVDGGFTLKLWARDLESNNSMLFKLSNDIGYIELTRYGNEFWISKWVNNVKLYTKYSSISGDINPEDQFFFFIQHVAETGLMNFDVTRITDGTITWYEPQTDNDQPPSIANTLYNSYNLEDGFLTNLSNGMKSILIPTNIDGVNTNCFIPSKDNLIGTNAYSIFQNSRPNEDVDYLEARDILGEYILGTTLLESDITTNTNISIRTKNNYTGANPVIVNYKLFDYATNSDLTIYEKIDDLTFNIRKHIKTSTILAEEFILDLTSVWDTISYGSHTLQIVIIDSTGFSYTKELSFGKALNTKGYLTQSAIDKNTNTTLTLTEGQAYKYYTRTIDSTDSNKLITIDSTGNISSEYPLSMSTGQRIVLNLPISARCTTYKDNGAYIITTKLNNIFVTQTLEDLKVGDKIKECFTIYSNENIEFTIVDKSSTVVTVMTDIITIKPFDVAENVLINGDAIWNDSNIKQWLNSNDKLVRRK